jgi:hypothetical protein
MDDCHKQHDVAILVSTQDKCSKASLSCIWSIRILVMILLLAVTISVAATVWSINYIFATTGVNSVSAKARRSEIDNVLYNVNKYFADNRGVQILHNAFLVYVY